MGFRLGIWEALGNLGHSLCTCTQCSSNICFADRFTVKKQGDSICHPCNQHLVGTQYYRLLFFYLLVSSELEAMNICVYQKILGHFSKTEAITLRSWLSSNSGNYILLPKFPLLFQLGVALFVFLPFQEKRQGGFFSNFPVLLTQMKRQI